MGKGAGVMSEWPRHLCQLTATGYKMVTYDTKIGVKGALGKQKGCYTFDEAVLVL